MSIGEWFLRIGAGIFCLAALYVLWLYLKWADHIEKYAENGPQKRPVGEEDA